MFSLLFIVLNAATNLYPETNNPIAVLAGLTFLNLVTKTELTPNAWSLTFEVWFYVFAAAFVFLAIRRPSKLGFFALNVVAALFIARYPIALYPRGRADPQPRRKNGSPVLDASTSVRNWSRRQPWSGPGKQ